MDAVAPRVCILLANSGGGHRSVALSLAEAFEGQAEVTLLNLLDEYSPFPFSRVSALYGPWTNHAPGIWRLAYCFGCSRRRVVLSECPSRGTTRSRSDGERRRHRHQCSSRPNGIAPDAQRCRFASPLSQWSPTRWHRRWPALPRRRPVSVATNMPDRRGGRACRQRGSVVDCPCDVRPRPRAPSLRKQRDVG
jgi:hypothetical protein